MRLLSANSYSSFSLTSFFSKPSPSYAILSHTREVDDQQEVTFHDLTKALGSSKRGYRKIQFCSEQAKKDGLQYFWVDSCCIDKSSSAELSEAINSMFRWYRDAAKCYVYLSDVSTGKHSRSSEPRWELAFRQSRWFTRGWTLQELLAPRSVEFFSRDTKRLGNKDSLKQQIHEITGIAVKALQGHLSQFSYNERRMWASKRETTIEEDQVYCLLGIFDVHLPLIYGEGKKNAFRRLRDEIDRSLTDNTEARWSQEKRACLQVLRTSDYEQFKNRNPDRLKGTCQWVLQHKNFQNWRKSNSSALLWISADPGCGKSVLSKSLIDEDLKSNSARTTCYFFFKDDNDVQRNIASALSALLHQLFSQKPILISHAMMDYATNGDELPKLFFKLWDILTKAVADPNAGEVVCILDALDECIDSGRYQIINAINAFYQNASSGNSSQLKFLITSRPYFDIERRFTELISDFPKIRLQGEQESDTIGREIDMVINWRVSKLGSELKLSDSERLNLETELLRMTHRTYLWLTLIFDIIRKTIRPTSRKLQAIVRTLPSTVDKAYEAILSKIGRDERPQARKLLHIIIAASRPLTLKEMNIALAVELYHQSYDDVDVDNEARFESSVRNLCGLFVTVVDRKIYLIHQTAKEFLIMKTEMHSDRWKHSFNPVESELVMTSACIAYLRLAIFSVESHLEHSVDRSNLINNHSFLSYAASFWTTHFRQAQSVATREVLQSVVQICDTQSLQFRNWFSIYWKSVEPYGSVAKSISRFMPASYFGHEVILKLLLATDLADIDSKNDEFGRTPLSWAAENGHEHVVKLLLATGKVDADSKDEESRTPLSWAAGSGHECIVKLLLETGKVDADSKDETGLTPLSQAAKSGHEAVVKLLLETGKVDADSKDDYPSRTPLSQAAEEGHETVVKMLLETGMVDVDSKDENYGRTPLWLAAENGHEHVAKLLLATGKVDVDPKDKWYGQTPLWWAVNNGHEGIVKVLLETGEVNADSKAKNGQTPLWRAVGNGHEGIVELLLATGKVDVNSKDDYGGTLLSLAAGNYHEAIVRLLQSSTSSFPA